MLKRIVGRGKFNWGVLGFDLIIFSLLNIWFAGGIPYGGHLYLKHGADPRRAAIILSILGYFLFPRLRKESTFLQILLRLGQALTRPMARWAFFAGVFGWACVLAIQQTLAMRVRLYDVGIFHQILWSITNGLGFHSTISGAGDFLKDHLSPSLLLFVPLFSVFDGNPLFLPVLQVSLIFLGAAAWIF